MIVCIYCNQTFLSTKNLNRHIKTAKYCIEIQKMRYLCQKCNTYFQNINVYNLHIDGCQKKHDELLSQKDTSTYELSQKDIINELQLKNIELQLKNAELNSIILELRSRLETTEKYTKSLLDITKASATKSTTTNNYNIQNNITTKRIRDALPTLTIDIAKEGPEGYSKWTFDQFLQGSVACPDVSRKKIIWKDSNDKLIKDYQGVHLCRKIFNAISNKNYKMIQKYVKKTKKYIEQCNDVHQINSMYEIILKLESIRVDCMDISQGNINSFMHKFVKHLISIINNSNECISDTVIENNENDNSSDSSSDSSTDSYQTSVWSVDSDD